MADKKPKWEWSVSRRRYLQNGRAVSEKRIRDGAQKAVENGKDKIGQITKQLVDGKINLPAWEVVMRAEIRAGHRAMAMLANGGKLTAAQAGKLGSAVKAQYKYLTEFRRQIEAGEIQLTARVVARARMYGQAMKLTYQNFVVLREKTASVAQAEWMLSPVENCAGCLEQSARGAQPIEDFPAFGFQQCMTSCQCWLRPIIV